MAQKPFDHEGMKDAIISYYQDGHSLEETAQCFKVSSVTVYNCLKRYNVPRRSKGEGKRWTPESIEQHRANLTGKSSGASGKTWKFDRPIHRPNLRGKNNAAWKGGIAPLAKRIRYIPEYRLWRQAVFKRDDYTCQQCGTRTCKGIKVILNVDHIIPFTVLVRQYNIVSVDDAINCTALWSIDNGRTLCEQCHRLTETYGLNLAHYHWNMQEERTQ